MEKREYNILCNYYYGIGKTEIIGIEDIRILKTSLNLLIGKENSYIYINKI